MLAALALAAAVLGVWGAPAAGAAEITEYQLGPRSQPSDITTGPDGNLWFTERGVGRIGRLTPDGQLREFQLPTPGADPRSITAGPDHLFFTQALGAKVGRISPDGTIRERSTQTCPIAPCGLRTANDIVVAPDGSPWFSVDTIFGAGTEEDAGYADICTTTPELDPGPCTTVDSFGFPGGHLSGGPTVGPDGAIWFTNRYERFVGRMPATGPRTVTRFGVGPESRPEAITAGPDGAVWFADEEGGRIGRLTTGGDLRYFSLPRDDASPSSIAAGPDGAVWFTESGAQSNAVGRITPDGQITRFPIPTPDSWPTGITLGPDGAMWFVERSANKIGRIEPPAPATPAPRPEPAPRDPEAGPKPGGPAPEGPATGEPESGSRPAGPSATTSPAPAVVTPALRRLQLRPTTYRRGARRLPVLRVQMTTGAAVELRIRRAGPGGRVRVNRRRRARPGSTRIVLRDVRRLAPGRYVVGVTPVGADGTRGRSRSVRLRIRR